MGGVGVWSILEGGLWWPVVRVVEMCGSGEGGTAGSCCEVDVGGRFEVGKFGQVASLGGWAVLNGGQCWTG